MMTTLLGYIGPGPGLNMAWAFLALLGTIALAVLSLLLWPIRMMIRWMRGGTTAHSGAAPQSVGGSVDDSSQTH